MKNFKFIIMSTLFIFYSLCGNISAFTETILARTYPDINLDISNRPDDNMRIDEFIALISHISYWSEGVSAPYATDKSGNTPSQWSAPYVQSEINKGFLKTNEFNYSDPATIAFAAKYLSNARGLYHWDFVNKYNVLGTEGLSAEDKMYLNVAFDNGLIKYTNSINASTVLKRKDIETMLLNKPFTKISQKTIVSDKTMKNLHVFFENNFEEMDYQFNLLQKYSNSITQVSFFGIKNENSVGAPIIEYDKPTQLKAIEYCKNNGIQTFLVLDNYNFFAENGGYSVYDQNATYKMLDNDDATVSSLLECMQKYDLDGINVTFDMYEGKEYREKFSAFMNKLSTELKKQKKMLMVSVGAYFKDADEKEAFYDYEALGKSCDFVHIILYDENSANAYNTGVISEPGCNSSLVYIDRVLKYASYKIPPEKILLGTQSYSIAFDSANKTASNIKFDISWLSSPSLVYNSEEGSGHISSNGKTIYFETDGGMKTRMLMAYDLKLNGMSSFSLTSEFAPIYTLLNSESPQRAEIISAMRKNLVPAQYYTNYSDGIKRDEFCDFAVKFIEAKTGKDIETYLAENNISVSVGKFSDTSSYNVSVANALGIVSGRSENTFGLETINRQEAAAMLSKLAELFGATKGTRVDFSDTSSLPDWAKNGIEFVSSLTDKTNSNRVMNGVGNGKFAPYGTYTKAQTIMTMIRLFNAL